MSLIRVTIGYYEDTYHHILDIGNHSVEEITSALLKSRKQLNLSDEFSNNISWNSREFISEINKLGYEFENNIDIIIFFLKLQDIIVEKLDLEIIDPDEVTFENG